MGTCAKRRRSEFDVLRLFAIFFVIYNHETFSAEYSPNSEWYFALLNGLCKTAVPIFFMMSGALLIPRESTWRKSLGRIGHFLLVMLFAYSLQVLVYTHQNGVTNVVNVFQCLVMSILQRYEPNGWSASWYLYAYLGFLVFLPILRCFNASMNRSIAWYMIVTSVLVTGVLPVVYAFIGIFAARTTVLVYFPYCTSSLLIPFGGCTYIFYALLGVAVDRGFQVERVSHWGRLGMAGIALAFLLLSWVLMAYCRVRYNDTLSSNNFFQAAFIVPVCVCVFLIVKSWFAKVTLTKNASAVLGLLGKSVLFVFLFENLFRLHFVGYRSVFEQCLSPYFASLLITVLSYVSALLCGVALRFIPGVRSLL